MANSESLNKNTETLQSDYNDNEGGNVSDGQRQNNSNIVLNEQSSAFNTAKINLPSFDHKKIKALVQESKKYFTNDLGEFVYYRTYARWIENEGRRETWLETVERFVSFMRENLGDKLTAEEYAEVQQAILKQETVPSMRLLQFAGPAARKSNVCAYNCSYIAPTALQDFAEIMYISMCGTGVGFSVERQNISKLPKIAKQTGTMLPTLVVPDHREGWCDALKLGLQTWYEGNDIQFDYSQLRPSGARLKTMGGKSSGPAPLRELLDFVRSKVLAKQGGQLSCLDAHDIICKIGQIVVAGGVRRSALISLSDLHDEEMRNAKQGAFYLTEVQRCLANNSAVYNQKPSGIEFMEEWLSLAKSGTGERGIFNRGSLKDSLPARRLAINDEEQLAFFGTNPCGEILLRSKQFCNLSEVIARGNDNIESLMRKVRIATILGTYQATLDKFPYLSKEWAENCREERLLGVSITGQWDCPVVRNAKVLQQLRDYSIQVNAEYAKRFEINQSTCITCVKPSGTVSKTFDTAAGLHPRFAPYYIQRIRISATDALFKMLKEQGVPHHPEVGQSYENANTFVLEFPVKAPEDAITKDQITALEQLEHWKLLKQNYTEHNPSVSIYVGPNEWLPVANWLYENWNIVGGLSFFPRSEHVYQLAVYEEITKEKYEELVAKMPSIDFSQIMSYELQDETENMREAACASGACDMI